eukprot:Gb_26632 [translate_table: standard]
MGEIDFDLETPSQGNRNNKSNPFQSPPPSIGPQEISAAKFPSTPELLPRSCRVSKRLSFIKEDNAAARKQHTDDVIESRKRLRNHDNSSNNKSSEPQKKPKNANGSESVRRSSRFNKVSIEEEEVEPPASPPRTEPPKRLNKSSKKPTRTSAKKRAKSATKVSSKNPNGNVDLSSRKPKNAEANVGLPSQKPKCIAQKNRKRPGKTVAAPISHGGSNKNIKKKPKIFTKVIFDGVEFRVGDAVYVRRIESSSDTDDPEVEECQICRRAGKSVMVECDDCLGGFHLNCLKPPLKEVPVERWVCPFCNVDKEGKKIQRPMRSRRRNVSKTARERLLSCELWAARIERLWKEVDGSYWFRGRWFLVPEETSIGKQPHNLKRELFQTNHIDDNEMESILRHCYVKGPKEFEKATDDGDDVFLCEYEYDIHWHTFKRLADTDVDEVNDTTDSENDWDSSEDSEEDIKDEEEECEQKHSKGRSTAKTQCSQKNSVSAKAVNVRRGHIIGLERIGTKKIPDGARRRQQSDLDKAKATLMLASSPGSLPCRNKEIEEIAGFVTGALAAGNQCLGRCLYIHGVPGTGKTATVLTVMKNLRAKADAESIQPYRFVEINGLKLATPENLYKVLYEALTGHRVGWKKALHLLNQRFSESKHASKDDHQPCILLVDELDLLVTRNQSVLYNIFDWPTRAHSRLIVIGIANTMDLPEKLLPRIASRMGMQRLCFGPYSHQQLQEIISSRLKGISAFDKQAVEFASRKVAAVSGDARRALELCRRAAELAEFRLKQSANNGSNDNTDPVKNLVGMGDIEAAIQEMFQAPHVQMMRRCSRLAKIFLVAMVYEHYKTGMSETTFEKIAITISFICTSNGEQCPDWDTLFSVGCRLGACRILLCEPGFRHRLQKLQLNFPSDDVTFALKDDKDLPWVSKYL